MLANGSLWRTLHAFGDPTEGTTPEGEIEWWKRASSEAATQGEKRQIEANRDFLAQMARKFRDGYFVSCWHSNPSENLAMWRAYTKSADAVAIQTSYSILKAQIPRYAYMGIVRYIDYASDRLPTFNLFQHIMHKDVYFQFENEVRIVAVAPLAKELGQEEFVANQFESERDRIHIAHAPRLDVKRTIQRVVLHPDSSPDFQSKIKEMCRTVYLPEPELSLSRRASISSPSIREVARDQMVRGTAARFERRESVRRRRLRLGAARAEDAA